MPILKPLEERLKDLRDLYEKRSISEGVERYKLNNIIVQRRFLIKKLFGAKALEKFDSE